MGSFFTNVHVRVPDGIDPVTLADRLRSVVEQQLEDEGFKVVRDGPVDREILIVPTKRWLAFYDPHTEDQSDKVEVWARDISQALRTEAVSVLVHDSDVLTLGLFANGKRRDAFDSNPVFSGKQASKVTPAARAEKWASVVAHGREGELAAAFEAKNVFAETALERVAPAIGASLDTLATGYNYLSREGEVPANVVRVRGRYAKRPAWEKRKTGAPRLASEWEGAEREPQRFLVGQPLHVCVTARNRGGSAPGLRIAIEASSDHVVPERIEAVIQKTGRFEMDRHAAELVRVDGRFVAELSEAALQPAYGGSPDALIGAPMDAMLDAHKAGQIHLNIFGTARAAGKVELNIELVPLANPPGRHVERLVVEVAAPRGVPLRAEGSELHPYMLDRLTSDAHSFLLVLLDARRDRVKAHAIELLASVREQWPKGSWHAFAIDESDVRELKVKKGAASWPVLEEAIRGAKGRVSGSIAPASSYESEESSGFEIDLTGELGAIAIWLAKAKVDREVVERALVTTVDAIAKQGKLVQALLARWQIEGGGTATPYEDVVGLQGDQLTARAWATRWLRGVGRGQLWLGAALRSRAIAPLPGLVDLGPAIRIPITDVAATETALTELLPTADDANAFES